MHQTHTHKSALEYAQILAGHPRISNNLFLQGKEQKLESQDWKDTFQYFPFCVGNFQMCSIFKCPTHYSVVNNLQVSKLSFCSKAKDLSAFKVDCCISFPAAIIQDYCGHREGIIAIYVWFCFPGRCWLQDVMWVYQMNMLKKR